MPIKDIKGQRFEKLKVLRYTDQSRYESAVWECKCDCGNIVLVPSKNLCSGRTKSCGCLRKEINEKAREKRNAAYIEGTNINSLCQQPKSRNKSGTVGICYEAKRDIWTAKIRFKGQTYHLGTYRSEDEAIAARKKAENALHGKFLKQYRQRKSSPDSPNFTDEVIPFDYDQVLSRHKYPDPSSRQQGTKRKNKSSKYVGVAFRTDTSRWRAYISIQGKRTHLGCYDSEELAAEAYDEKAKELYGEHARLNFG